MTVSNSKLPCCSGSLSAVPSLAKPVVRLVPWIASALKPEAVQQSSIPASIFNGLCSLCFCTCRSKRFKCLNSASHSLHLNGLCTEGFPSCILNWLDFVKDSTSVAVSALRSRPGRRPAAALPSIPWVAPALKSETRLLQSSSSPASSFTTVPEPVPGIPPVSDFIPSLVLDAFSPHARLHAVQKQKNKKNNNNKRLF